MGCEDGSFECMIVDRCMGDHPCPTPQPTEGNSGWGNPKPEPSKPSRTPRPTPSKPSKTPRPTWGEKTPRPIKEKTPRPTKAKPVKTPRPTKAKPQRTPRPTPNKVKTARPTKGKPVRTPKPTQVYLQPTPKPTVGSGWGAEQPSKDILENENAEMVGLLSIATVVAICGYSMMCKRRKEDSYSMIE